MINKIDIDVLNVNIEINDMDVNRKEEQVYIVYGNKVNIEEKVVGNCIYIYSKPNIEVIDQLVIEIDSNKIKDVKILNGSCKTEVEDIKLSNLEIKSYKGDIVVGNVEADNITTINTTGVIAINNIKTNILKLENNSGNSSINDIVASEADIYSIAGDNYIGKYDIKLLKRMKSNLGNNFAYDLLKIEE